MEFQTNKSLDLNLVDKSVVDSCATCKEARSTKGSKRLFLKSVSVWINKPHVVNRRLCGSKIIRVFRVKSKEDVNCIIATPGAKILSLVIGDDSEQPENFICFNDLSEESTPFLVLIRELIPKSEFFPNLREAIIYDKDKVIIHFLPLDQEFGINKPLQTTSELSYAVSFKPIQAQANEIQLTWSCDHKENKEPRRQITSQWLRSVLLEKLISWSHLNDISTAVTSLQLVEVDCYKDIYVRLKNTYGRDLVKNWTERTDPKKFVYEDVAIAAYLLLLWEKDRQMKNLAHKQSFVDLGCGNGLLVYILTKEGHRGLGIDLRRRKIWDTFGSDIDLREDSIRPSADHLYPEFDWIIGNHSDELTPWIPVISARSSYNSSFFLLPCCHYDFVGKFGLSEKGKSRYASYLDYVKEIIISCGFYPECDTLRIPSTKRICFTGRKRLYDQQSEAKAETERQKFLEERINRCHCLHHQNQSSPSVSATQMSCPQVAASVSPLLPPSPASDPVTTSNNLSPKTLLASSISFSQHYHADQVEDGTVISVITDGNSKSMQITKGYKSILNNTTSELVGIQQSIFCYETQKRSLEIDGLYPGSSFNESTCKKLRGDLVNPKENSHSDLQLKSNQLSKYNSLTTNVDEPTYGEMTYGNETNCVESSNACPVQISRSWAADFKPRSVEQGVRNCQRVAEETKEMIVQRVFQQVLEAANASSVWLNEEKRWRKGGSVPLCEMAALFDKSTLQQLKAEYGGLQTLLRNHSHIFQVTGGQVQLRDFSAEDPWAGKKQKKGRGRKWDTVDLRKTSLCWFDSHHPDGCPRSASNCPFAHGLDELRQKTTQQDIRLP